MSTKSDLYRSNAEECRQRAAHTSNSDAKAAWLELARSWSHLLDNERRWGWLDDGPVWDDLSDDDRPQHQH